MTKKRLVFWLLLIGFILADQGVKAWVRGALPVGGSFRGLPIPGVFEITLTYNTGIAFGKLEGHGVGMAPVAILIAAAAIWYTHRNQKEGMLTHVAFALLASGALGNLIDRVWHQRVTDMFYFRLINFPVFNVADSCITIATILLLLGWLLDAKKSPDQRPTTDSPETNP